MLKKTLCLLLVFLFGNTFAAYQAKLTDFPKNMNQCFSCDNTKYAPLNYPVYGGFVSVEGHNIWVEKYGSGRPAVILLNGGGETIRQWNKNIPSIAKYTTVIAYDRLGLGLSEDGDFKPRSAKDIVNRLQIVLKKIHVKPPYVLVAHSIGGLYLSYFARQYPNQIAGLVDVDANNIFQIDLHKADIKNLPNVTEKGIDQLLQPPTHLTEVTQQAKAYLKQKSLTKIQHAKLIEDLEVRGKEASVKQIENLGPLPKVPLISLAEGAGNDIGHTLWRSTIQQFANEEPCHIYKFVPNSSHHIMIDQPKTVNDAIKMVVMAARAHETLCGKTLD